MRLIKKRQHTVLNLPSLRLEGGLFLPDQLEKAALGTAHHQTEADYGNNSRWVSTVKMPMRPA